MPKRSRNSTQLSEPEPKKQKERQENLLVGTHVSVAGGFFKAVERAHGYGASSFAIFTESRNKKFPISMDEASMKKWHDAMEKFGFDYHHIVPHGSYFVNLGSPKEDTRKRSRDLFCEEMKRCQKLRVPYLNIHPGSCSSGKEKIPLEESIGYIADSINWACEQVPNVMVLLENTAGAGSTIGRSFEEIKQIMDLVSDPTRVGVCLDTCHLFAAGYDIRTQEEYEKTMTRFDEVVGLAHLKAIHLNDTKEAFHSNKDRHIKIGEGIMGEACFAAFMKDERLRGIPLILETPTTDHEWEIDYLHTLGRSTPKADPSHNSPNSTD